MRDRGVDLPLNRHASGRATRKPRRALASGKVLEKQPYCPLRTSGVTSPRHVDVRLPTARSQVALQVTEIIEVLGDLDPRHGGRGPVEASTSPKRSTLRKRRSPSRWTGPR